MTRPSGGTTTDGSSQVQDSSCAIDTRISSTPARAQTRDQKARMAAESVRLTTPGQGSRTPAPRRRAAARVSRSATASSARMTRSLGAPVRHGETRAASSYGWSRSARLMSSARTRSNAGIRHQLPFQV